MARFSWPLAAAILLLGASPVAAAGGFGAQNDADLRCLAAAAANAGSTQDRNGQVAATIAAMYWLGRLQGRNTSLDLEAELTRVASTLTDAQLVSEGVRCSLLLKAQGRTLVEIGNHMTARGQ